MDRTALTKKIGRIGIMAGLAAFLAFGILQGALVGGTVGLNAGAYLFGPADGGLAVRTMAGTGMIMGVLITGAMFMTCGLAAGMLAGALITTHDAKDEASGAARTR